MLSAYGSMAFPLAAGFIILQVMVPTHYAEATALSLSSIGTVMLLARLWDTITDPLIGFLSDKTPRRFGRRRIWVIGSVPLLSLAIYHLFNPGADAGVSYLLGWTFLIYVAGTMAIVPMNAWGAELSPDYGQRSRVTGLRAAFGLTGSMAALMVPVLLGQQGAGDLGMTLQLNSWLVIGTLFIAAAVLFVVPDDNPTYLPKNQVKDALTLIWRPSPFRQLIVSFLLNGAGNAIPATLFLFYVSYVLQVPEMAGPLLFLYFVCAAVSVPFWIWISSSLGKHRTWHWSILIACLLFFWTPFLGEGDLMLYIFIVIGTGITTGCDLIIPSSMNGDLVEWDTAENGCRRPGMLFAIWGTTTKLSYALAIGIAFPLLDLFTFSAGGENSPDALMALAVLYGGPCIAFKVLALYTMRKYPITEAVYRKILEKSQAIS
jgi:Na+/melibiose symporter-like transporter